jgi:hypothetical protein
LTSNIRPSKHEATNLLHGSWFVLPAGTSELTRTDQGDFAAAGLLPPVAGTAQPIRASVSDRVERATPRPCWRRREARLITPRYVIRLPDDQAGLMGFGHQWKSTLP